MIRRWLLAGVLAAGALVFGGAGFCPSVALGAGDLTRAQCPNEGLSGFSSALPDCRAYEMVTPPYKEGYPIVTRISEYAHDGEQAFFDSFADLARVAGDGESNEGTVYLDSRTSDGWALSPVDPSSGVYVQRLVEAEPESGVSLWELHTLAQPATAEELYLRSPGPGGGFSVVGPLTPPQDVLGEPSDTGVKPATNVLAASEEAGEVYGHLILRAEKEGRWAFDHTQGNGTSLYEYTGTDNTQPTLAGVFGEKGSTALAGVVEGQLAGFECGMEAGGAGSLYNAVARDGETIFFTPLVKESSECEAKPATVAPSVAEVWARVHGSAKSPLPAETVDVSARSPSECTGACETSVESGKLFMGASESSEKVFFTSTQQLLDGAHQDSKVEDNAAGGKGCAGTTGEGGCNLYEYDFAAPAGHKLKLVAGGAEVLGVARISEDGARVYFVARGVLTPEANEFGAHAQPGQPNLYVYNTVSEQLEPHGFIATLDSATDKQDWSAVDRRPVQSVPADGRFLVFASSTSGLTPDDSAKAGQLFEYDTQSGELVRISKAEGEETGLAENGNATESTIESPVFSYSTGTSMRSVAETEQEGVPVVTVAFESRGRLSARASAAQPTDAAPHGCTSVYEYRSSGPVNDGGVRLISDGRDTQPQKGHKCGAEFNGMDASGNNILFQTTDSLLPGDADGGQVDTYDARVNGGFPVADSEARPCGSRAACGTASSPAGAVLAPSSLQAAEGNAAAPTTAKTVTAAKRSTGSGLARALRACRAKRGARRRASCEARARRRYAAKPTKRSSGRKSR